MPVINRNTPTEQITVPVPTPVQTKPKPQGSAPPAVQQVQQRRPTQHPPISFGGENDEFGRPAHQLSAIIMPWVPNKAKRLSRKRIQVITYKRPNLTPAQKDRAKKVELVVLPKSISGKSCGSCMLPGTQVVPHGDIIAASKSLYSGEAVKLFIVSGRSISLTINHPVLTKNGLVSAGDIKEGDYLSCDPISIEDIVINTDLQKTPTRIEEVFDTLSLIGNTRSFSPSILDFNGDGEFINSDIDVVYSNRFLKCKRDITEAQISADFFFTKPNHRKVFFSNKRPTNSFIHGSLNTTTSSMGQPSLINSLGIGHFTPYSFCSDGPSVSKSRNSVTQFTGIRHTSYSDTSFIKFFTNQEPANIESISDTILSFPIKVRFNDVVRVERFHYDGPVYDLETTTGIIIANKFHISNCKFAKHHKADKSSNNLYCFNNQVHMNVKSNWGCKLWDQKGVKRLSRKSIMVKKYGRAPDNEIRPFANQVGGLSSNRHADGILADKFEDYDDPRHIIVRRDLEYSKHPDGWHAGRADHINNELLPPNYNLGTRRQGPLNYIDTGDSFRILYEPWYASGHSPETHEPSAYSYYLHTGPLNNEIDTHAAYLTPEEHQRIMDEFGHH